MPVLEVGIGVGYLKKGVGPLGPLRACRFNGLGRPGEEDGSKGGSKEGAGRLALSILGEQTGGREGSPAPSSSVDLMGEELILMLDDQRHSSSSNKGVEDQDKMINACGLRARGSCRTNVG
jgi:hypothetical protein